MFNAGDRVETPDGPGEVYYRRMAPPHYSEVGFYSVKLDSKKSNRNYTGSIYSANEVFKEEKE